MKPTTILLLPVLPLTTYATSTKETANYDNINAAAINVVGGTNPGTYQSISYNSAWGVANTSAEVIGVEPHTAPNVIFTTGTAQLMSGSPASLTVAKPYTSFGLTDFWFGCLVRDGEAVAAVASQCTVTVAGFNGLSNQEVALASFTFTPPDAGVGQIPELHAVLPSTFLNSGIKNVTFQQDTPLVKTLSLDSVSYYLYK